ATALRAAATVGATSTIGATAAVTATAPTVRELASWGRPRGPGHLPSKARPSGRRHSPAAATTLGVARAAAPELPLLTPRGTPRRPGATSQTSEADEHRTERPTEDRVHGPFDARAPRTDHENRHPEGNRHAVRGARPVTRQVDALGGRRPHRPLTSPEPLLDDADLVDAEREGAGSRDDRRHLELERQDFPGVERVVLASAPPNCPSPYASSGWPVARSTSDPPLPR